MTLPFEALRPLLTARPIAHRGLWSADGAPENSPAAFIAARDSGFGIELDVRLTREGEVVVFHDAGLRRMTGAGGKLAEQSLDELAPLRLAGTDKRIPTLRDVLAAVGAETLVLVELKTGFGEAGPLEAATAEVLDGHHGPAAVIGFNPMTHAWFAEHRPSVARGLNSYGYDARTAPGLSDAERAALAAFGTLDVAQPHFILPGLDILDSAPVARLRWEGLPVITWTVRTREQAAAARGLADNIIFEGEALG